ncbi:MAG TPA: CBS domain-containing protein [Pirellulales bacterium]|jgi:CBS domain-containing protein|nr:CBS domain-containing protein [Pirellulales bacterium]
MHRLDVKRIQIADALRWCGGCAGQGRLRVRDVMTPAPTCIASSTSVLDVVRMFHAKEFRHLLVTDSRGRLLGLVSDRDVLRCFGPGRYPDPEVLAGIAAAEIMSADLLTARPDQALLLAATEMLAHGISCLPVLADDKLVGILTSTDLSAVLEVLLQTSHAATVEQSERASSAVEKA